MKKITLLFSLFALAFSVEGFAQFGCSTGVAITDGYTATGITTPGTAGPEDWNSPNPTMPCTGTSASYWDDDVYLFTYTAGATDEEISMTIFSRSSWNGLGIFETCTGTALDGCLASQGSSASNANRTATANISAGQTVYIAAGQWGTPNNLDFDVISFSATPLVNPPSCTTLSDPVNGATDASLSGDISWTAATGAATDYLLQVGTTSGGTDVYNAQVGNVTTFNVGPLAESTTYYVTITPSNSNGVASDCAEESFTTLTPEPGDFISNAIAFTPSAEGTVCDTAEYPFSYDFTILTDSGLDGSCNGTSTGKDVFLSWTATSDALIWNDGSGGNPGIVIRDAGTGNEITCAGTFAADDTVLSGWTVGQDLILQVYDFGTASVNPVNFCVAEYTLPSAPDCVTDPVPADASTEVPAGTVTVSWTAATTGPAATSYDVYSGLLADFSDQTLRGNTTTTTFDLTGVGFNQTVYWRVVPKNGPSENTTCEYWSFTSAGAPTGALCTDPIVVAALPFNEAAGTTSGFGDDYTGSPGATGCGTTSSYLNGDDIVYAYTATADTQISIDMLPSGTWSGVFVYTDCADIGTACVAGVGNSGTAVREIDLDVTNGTTYYIVISTFAAPQTVDFTLDIFENTCTNSVATYTVVNDCDVSGGFLIDVEITDLGTATSLTVSNNQDATTYNVTAINTPVQFGPYVNATDVIITVADNDDATCTYSSAALTQAVCPPSNDDIANATAITIGEMICDGTTNNGTNEGATDSGEGAGTCFVGGAGADVWYTFTVASDSNVDVSTDYLGGTLVDTQIAIYSGSPGALTQVACSQDEGVVILSNGSSWNSLITNQAVTAGTYYIQVSGYNGAEGTFCLSVDISAPANDECATAEALTLGTEVSADNTGATDSMVTGDCFTGAVADLWYSFVATSTGEVTITTTAAQYGVYSDCAGTQVGACNTSVVSGLTDGTTYYVRVSDDGTARAQAPGPFTLTVAESSLSVDDFNTESLFSYYPNPVNDNLTLQAQKEITNVSVYNMIGQEVYRNAPNTLTNEVNMSTLQSGAYFVKVTVGNATETIKVIKN